MKKTLMTTSVLLLFIALCPAWDSIKTDQFTVFYQPEYKARALRLLTDIDYYRMIPEGIVGNKSGNVPFVLDDLGGYVNGITDPVYYNIHIMNYETEDADWLAYVAVHEYTHMVHLTEAGGVPAVFTALFGNIASAQLFAPDWTFEAIAVYNESKISKYMGRINDGVYSSYIGICVSENNFPSLLKATYTPLEFPLGDGIYLFGSQFLNYLAQTYGEDKLKKFYASYSSSLLSYLSPVFPWIGIDMTMKEVFGADTLALWDKWKASAMDSYKYFKQEGSRVTDHGWFAGSPVIRGDKLYYEKNVYEKTGVFGQKAYDELVEMNLKSGERKTILRFTSSLTQPVRFSGNKMYYSIYEIKPGYANKFNGSYGTYTVIYERDLDTGAEREVAFGDIRAFYIPYDGKLICAKDDPDSVTSSIYEVNLENGDSRLLFDADHLVLSLDGNAERTIAAAKQDGENVGIYSLDLKMKKFTALVNTPYYESDPELYGDRVFFNANYGKIYSAYCYDLGTKKTYRLTENGTAGTPAYYEAGNEIYFAGTSVNGFDIYKKKAEFKPFDLPEDRPDYVLPPLLDASKIKQGGYADDLATLVPRVRLPLVLLDSNYRISDAAFLLSGADAIGDFNYTAGGVYDISRRLLGYTAQLNSYILAPVLLNVSSDSLYNTDYKAGRIDVSAGIPLYMSVRPGISDITLGLMYEAFDGLDRRQLGPALTLGFVWPSTELSVQVRRAFEGSWIGSDYAGRQATYGDMIFTQYVPDGKITLRGTAIFDPDNSDNVLTQIRGYSAEAPGNKGSEWAVDYTRPLFKIRQGLWNPVNVYVEDMCADFFFDSAFALSSQYSCGGELHLETKWFFYLPVDLGVRLSVNRERQPGLTLIVNTTGIAF